MKYLVPAITFLGALVAQRTIADFMAIYEVKPNFIVIYLIFLSLKFGRVFGCLAGFFIGLVEDAFSSTLFGLSAFCKSFIGFFTHNVPIGFMGTSIFDTGFLIFMVTLSHNFLYGWIFSFGTEVDGIYLFFRFALPGAIYTSLIGLIVWGIYPKLLVVTYEKS